LIEPPLLAIHNASLGYGRHVVLRVEQLTIRRGEIWFVLGPNGSGKTTLLRTVMGLLPLISGHIDRSPMCEDVKRMGFVPQRCEMRPSLPLTLQEFVSLGLVGLPTKREERKLRLRRALDHVGLGAHTRDSFWTLSGGQQQRALLARALIREPLLLVMDEPTNGLDPSAEEALLEVVIRSTRTNKLSALVVTHDIALAVRHATHLALIRSGALESGTCEELASSDRLASVFGVDPLARTA
jgi:ABC-type Mn2+/Zn2+ transport system ATPase subunit